MATRKTLGFRKSVTGSAAFDKLSVGSTFSDPEVANTSVQMTGNLALRLPLLTQAKREAITPSAANVGMMVYDVTNLGIFTSNGSEWVEAGAGIYNQGTVTADPNPAEAGVYTLDSSGGAFNFTLPAATGSQAEVTIISGNVPNDEAVTVRVQTGEALNGTTNGTLVIRESGQLYTATDRSTGNWDIFSSTKATDLQPVALPDPLIVAHRGLPYQCPEHSLLGYKKCIQYGVNVIEIDAHVLLDGELVSIHDSTVNGTTQSTGNVNTFTSGGWQKIKYSNSYAAKDVTSYLLDPSTVYCVLLKDIFAELGTSAIYVIENKSADADTGTKVVELLKEYGLTNRAIIQDFNQSRLDSLITTYADQNLGLRWMYLNNSITGTAAAAKGYDYVGHGTGVSDAFITDLVNNGVGPVVYTLLFRREWAIWQAKGCVGCFADDAPWIAEVTDVYTSDPFNNIDLMSGFLETRAENTATINASGHMVPTLPDVLESTITLQGWGCPIAAAASSYTIQFSFDLGGTNPNTTASLQIGVCSPSDQFNDAGSHSNGYNCLIRQAGTLQVYRISNGSATLLDSNAGSGALTASTNNVVQVSVSPTQVIFSYDGNSVTVNDTTHRGAYFTLGVNFKGNAWDVQYHSVTIS